VKPAIAAVNQRGSISIDPLLAAAEAAIQAEAAALAEAQRIVKVEPGVSSSNDRDIRYSRVVSPVLLSAQTCKRRLDDLRDVVRA